MNDKPIPAFQAQVAEFIQSHNLETTPSARLLDLLSELGEVAKEVLKGSEYGKTNFTPTPDWEEELSDAFFSLVCLANSTGVDLEAGLENVLAKYKSRLLDKDDPGSGK